MNHATKRRYSRRKQVTQKQAVRFILTAKIINRR